MNSLYPLPRLSPMPALPTIRRAPGGGVKKERFDPDDVMLPTEAAEPVEVAPNPAPDAAAAPPERFDPDAVALPPEAPPDPNEHRVDAKGVPMVPGQTEQPLATDPTFPVGSEMNPADKAENLAPVGATMQASLAAKPEEQLNDYAAAMGQPPGDFKVIGDKVARKIPPGQPNAGTWVYVEPKDLFKGGVGESAQRLGHWAASGTGQAIPIGMGTAAATAAGLATAPSGPGAFAAASIAGATGGATGEVIRQKLRSALAPDATPMDWANVGWQALQNGLGPTAGKVASGVGTGAKWAGQKLGSGTVAVATKLGNAIQSIPGLQGILAKGQPIVQSVSQALDEGGTNLLGLTDEARQAVMAHLRGTVDDIRQAVQSARDNWGIDLSIGQATESPVIQQTERQIARTPHGAEAFAERRQLQNDTQIPGAMNKMMDEISPVKGAEKQVRGFRQAAAKVESGARDEQAKRATVAYSDALDDPANPLPFSDKLRALFERPMMKEAWERAQTSAANRGQELPKFVEFNAAGDPIFSKEVQPTWRSIDQIKRALDTIRNDNVNLRGKPTGKGADADSLRRSLLGIVDPINPKYPKARAEFGESADAIDQVLKGGVGLIQKMKGPERQNMISRIFSGTNLLPEEIARTRTHFMNAGKLNEWNAGVRSHLEGVLNEALKPTQGGERSNVGGKLYRGLWGDKRQEDVIKAAVGDPALVARWDSLGDALRRAAHQLPEGSPTPTDIPEALGIRGLAGKAVSAAKAALSPTHAALSAIQDFAEKGQTPEMRRQIVDYMLTTDGDKQLRALQSTLKAIPPPKPGQKALLPPRAQVLLGEFLSDAAGHAASNATRSD